MKWMALIIGAAMLAQACSSGSEACVYTATDDATGESREVETWPATWYPVVDATGPLVDSAEVGISATTGESLTVEVPGCLRAEAQQEIAERQAADSQQAKDGIAFEDRTY